MPIKKIFLASSEELRADRTAFELMLGQLNQEWITSSEVLYMPYYFFNRALCTIKLDGDCNAGKPSSGVNLKATLRDLRTARKGIDAEFDELIEQSYNVDIQKWLQINGSPHST